MHQSYLVMSKFISGAILVLGIFVIIGGFLPIRYKGDYDLRSFATLPVLEGGRLKPLDSVARNSLLVLRGRQTFTDSTGVKREAIVWLLDTLLNPEAADTHAVYRVTNRDLLGLLGHQTNEIRYFSFNELRPHLQEVEKQVQQVNEEAQLRTPYERALVKLRNSLILYHRLVYSLHSPNKGANIEEEYRFFESIIPESIKVFRQQQSGQEYDEEIFNRFMSFAKRYRDLSEIAGLRAIPPPDANGSTDNWSDIGTSLMAGTFNSMRIDPVVIEYAKLADAYRSNNPTQFNLILTSLIEKLDRRFKTDRRKIGIEYLFNSTKPFLIATVLYTIVFLVAAASWAVWPKTLGRTAFLLLSATFLLHTIGLLVRMYLQGRPPITNLYSSAVFVGWAAVVLSMILERISRNGIGSAVAALIGFATLIIAHNLTNSGDTLEMMQAVLDDNFWLATHVVIINIGYSATFLAGFLALIFTLRGFFTKGLDENTAQALARTVYGVICFALLFSFAGTVLGGIWADQSWGRFWGWDPKENGALMIVIWNAIILHTRWGGLVRRQGLMALAIGGNIITAWSWFGTNMLGIGLHSYGHMDRAVFWLLTFIVSQVLLIFLTLLPSEQWRSPQAQGRL